ncbi:hypothetical protein VSK91_05550 [Bacillus swezeyi]|uniref:hypothetical protein n=1 Tax=Bacillus swezeyi TaxID=1925020 RepID=UPI0039C6EFBB
MITSKIKKKDHVLPLFILFFQQIITLTYRTAAGRTNANTVAFHQFNQQFHPSFADPAASCEAAGGWTSDA